MLALLLAAAVTPATISLGWPVACEVGRTCFVQNYVDADPGPGARDYACGSMSYDGHDGVDIRLPSLRQMRAGVAVLAAAAGRVEGIRDGVPDVSIRAAGAPSVKGIECGNGVAVIHAGGWRTQYCHLKRGSVRVRTGQTVTAGEPLGQVGLSGDTEFPHLHLTVYRADATAKSGYRPVDPFADGGKGCRTGRSLWRADVAARAAYHSPSLLLAGFSDHGLSNAEIDEGPSGAPTRNSPVIVAYVRAIGLERGDTQVLSLTAPNGEVSRNAIPVLDRAKAQSFAFAGKRRTGAMLANGVWRASYEVHRGGKVVLSRTWAVTL